METSEKFLRGYIHGAIGAVMMSAGDWLLSCVPLQEADTGMFDRAYYLSGAYGLWRSVLTVGLGAVGGFLYYFVVKALNADSDAKYRKTKSVQYLCGIFTVAVALTIHTWVATIAPMYVPMILAFGIHFVMLLAGKTRYSRWMLAFHPVTWNLLLVTVPDIAQAMQVPVVTWMSVMSQSSTNTAIVIWCIAAAVYERSHTQ